MKRLRFNFFDGEFVSLDVLNNSVAKLLLRNIRSGKDLCKGLKCLTCQLYKKNGKCSVLFAGNKQRRVESIENIAQSHSKQDMISIGEQVISLSNRLSEVVADMNNEDARLFLIGCIEETVDQCEDKFSILPRPVPTPSGGTPIQGDSL